MNNTTTVLASTGFELTNNYDSIGAIIFIIVVIFWYSLSVAFLMGMQMITPKEIVEESNRHSKRLYSHSFHEKTNNKGILEELVDKEKRIKLWDIYLGASGEMDDRATQADTLRVQNMQRKLAILKKEKQHDDGEIEIVNENNSLKSKVGSSLPDLSSINNQLRVRRQLSTEQQILEQWQTAMSDFRVNENWPWAIQKLFIRRHLRRRRKIRKRSLQKRAIL